MITSAHLQSQRIAVLFSVFLFLISGCQNATISGGSRYMQNHNDTVRLAEQKNYSHAANTMGAQPSQDTILFALDKGMLLHRAGRFRESFDLYAQYFPQFKFSAEQEVSSSFWRDSLAAVGNAIDQLTGNGLVGTGTYRYAYGMQLYGPSAKYHCSTAEVGRVATFQLLNAIKNNDLNAGRVAMQHLVDLQPFQREYTEHYPFLDYSYNELLTLVFLGMMKDDSGSSVVAYNQAVSANQRAMDHFSPGVFEDRYSRRFSKVTSQFTNAYHRNLKGALKRFAQNNRRMKHGLRRDEIMSSRLVDQEDYDQLSHLINNKNIDPVIDGVSSYYQDNLMAIQNCLKQNESLLKGNFRFPEGKGCAIILFEVGTVPGIHSAQTEIPYSFLDKYTAPEKSLTISVNQGGYKSNKVKPIVLLDPDLFLQLDYHIYLDMLTSRVANKISSLENALCSNMASYYSKLDRYKYSLQNAIDNRNRKHYRKMLSDLERNEPNRRRLDHKRAWSEIRSMRYDQRIWRSQPNKVYFAVLNDLPAGKSMVNLKSDRGVIKQIPLNVKAGAISFEVIGDL